jgi:hypothetical protein
MTIPTCRRDAPAPVGVQGDKVLQIKTEGGRYELKSLFRLLPVVASQ